MANDSDTPFWAKRSWIKQERKEVDMLTRVGIVKPRQVSDKHANTILGYRKLLAEQGPDALEAKAQENLEVTRDHIIGKIAQGHIKTGAAAWSTGQDLIDEMWARIAPHHNLMDNRKLPRIVAVPDALWDNKTAAAMVRRFMPDYIFMPVSLLKRLERNNHKGLRATLAHELGHILNQDPEVVQVMEKIQQLRNEATELLADRMGAIAYGNPRQYIQQMRKSKAPILNAMLRDEDMDENPQQFEKLAKVHRRGNPSPMQRLRMAERWADILEEQRATDKDGNITDYAKALAVFDRSAKQTRSLGAIDSFTTFQEMLADTGKGERNL